MLRCEVDVLRNVIKSSSYFLCLETWAALSLDSSVDHQNIFRLFAVQQGLQAAARVAEVQPQGGLHRKGKAPLGPGQPSKASFDFLRSYKAQILNSRKCG